MGNHKKRIIGGLLALGGTLVTAALGWGVEQMLNWLSRHFHVLTQISRETFFGWLGIAFVAAGVGIAVWPSKRRPNKIEALAVSALLLASEMEIALRRDSMERHRSWAELVADSYALRVRLEKVRFQTPRFRSDADQYEIGYWMHRYLLSVGTLLRDGSIAEGRQMAVLICANVPRDGATA